MDTKTNDHLHFGLLVFHRFRLRENLDHFGTSTQREATSPPASEVTPRNDEPLRARPSLHPIRLERSPRSAELAIHEIANRNLADDFSPQPPASDGNARTSSSAPAPSATPAELPSPECKSGWPSKRSSGSRRVRTFTTIDQKSLFASKATTSSARASRRSPPCGGEAHRHRGGSRKARRSRDSRPGATPTRSVRPRRRRSSLFSAHRSATI